MENISSHRRSLKTAVNRAWWVSTCKFSIPTRPHSKHDKQSRTWFKLQIFPCSWLPLLPIPRMESATHPAQYTWIKRSYWVTQMLNYQSFTTHVESSSFWARNVWLSTAKSLTCLLADQILHTHIWEHTAFGQNITIHGNALQKESADILGEWNICRSMGCIWEH